MYLILPTSGLREHSDLTLRFVKFHMNDSIFLSPRHFYAQKCSRYLRTVLKVPHLNPTLEFDLGIKYLQTT